MRSITTDSRTTGQRVGKIYHRGEMADFLFHEGQIVWTSAPIPLPDTVGRMARDASGEWYEVGFLSAVPLAGNAGAGWTDPGKYARIHWEQSVDLAQWYMGRFVPAPVPTEPGPDGSTWYWARAVTPRLWEAVRIDLEIRSTRGRKSITRLRVFGAEVDLPGYPYEIETEAAGLQADLVAAGFAGAVVSYEDAPYFVTARTHQQSAGFGQEIRNLFVMHDGEDVVDVRPTAAGATIPLPGYPYSLPGSASALQQDLRDAGQSGAVVQLHGGEWVIRLPDLDTTFNLREFRVEFTPGDPFPVWDSDGVFQGYSPGDALAGTFDNLRPSGGGATLLEEPKQFARLVISPGNRYET